MKNFLFQKSCFNLRLNQKNETFLFPSPGDLKKVKQKFIEGKRITKLLSPQIRNSKFWNHVLKWVQIKYMKSLL